MHILWSVLQYQSCLVYTLRHVCSTHHWCLEFKGRQAVKQANQLYFTFERICFAWRSRECCISQLRGDHVQGYFSDIPEEMCFSVWAHVQTIWWICVTLKLKGFIKKPWNIAHGPLNILYSEIKLLSESTVSQLLNCYCFMSVVQKWTENFSFLWFPKDV